VTSLGGPSLSQWPTVTMWTHHLLGWNPGKALLAMCQIPIARIQRIKTGESMVIFDGQLQGCPFSVYEKIVCIVAMWMRFENDRPAVPFVWLRGKTHGPATEQKMIVKPCYITLQTLWIFKHRNCKNVQLITTGSEWLVQYWQIWLSSVRKILVASLRFQRVQELL